MPRHLQISLIVLCVIAFCLPEHGVYAFGAGNIPSSAYLEGRAFRHGDIEDTLIEIAKRTGAFGLGALIGRGGSKFTGLDIKRVYFGNWLRDYSQAVDVAGLQKLQLQTIVNLCMVLGFMSLGFATDEFEVTPERLGVYLPIEHIDNPKGYPDNARQFDSRLRAPVDPRELEIDPRTGMKNYIANEHGSWDTSKGLVRRTLHRCIQLGRQHRAHGQKADEYEAYRLLGQALHTLEDFAAHSNFCELSLVALGHREVFVHVGDHVRIQAPDGRWVAPLVTGTFGANDFIHSLLGEATDHINQASVVDLNAELDRARAQTRSGPGDSSASPTTMLRGLLFKLPDKDGSKGELDRELVGVERIHAQGYGTQPGMRRPEEMSPHELQSVLWQVLRFRDNVMKKLTVIIEKIPGLESLVEKISDSITVFVFTTLEPFLRPIMKDATNALMAASSEAINKHDQYEVFDNPRASDPTHSFLSKDHFNLILNEPAGHLGKIILTYAVTKVVKAWDDPSIDVHHVTDDILHCMFHPDFHIRHSPIQHEMMDYMRTWIQGLGHQQPEILRRLTKQSVRNHLNIRLGSESSVYADQGTFAQTAGMEMQHDLLSTVPGLAQAQTMFNEIGGRPHLNAIPNANYRQALPGMLAAGMDEARTTINAPAVNAQASVAFPPRQSEYEHEQPTHGNPHHHHGHHGHGHHHPGSEHHSHQAQYYSESHTMNMPTAGGGVVQTSNYNELGGAPRIYAPPPGPPPTFFSGSDRPPSGYAPTYVGYSTEPVENPSPRDSYGMAPGSGYGGFAPFPGPGPFSDGRTYPPPRR